MTQSILFKFLDPTGATYYDGKPFYYVLPRPDQKWSDPTMHPDPVEPDGNPCGPGRLHAMKHMDAQYAPQNWWPWAARPVGPVTGADNEKLSAPGLRLRRISPEAFARCLRPPFNWGRGRYLTGANLRRADLRWANLRRADLRRADLRWANLRRADLSEAYLSGADLTGADLREADLSRANLSGADLSGADLSEADLCEADLRWADLRGADLTGANLYGAYLRWADLYGADLSGANLSGANLYRANLTGANLSRAIGYEQGVSA